MTQQSRLYSSRIAIVFSPAIALLRGSVFDHYVTGLQLRSAEAVIVALLT